MTISKYANEYKRTMSNRQQVMNTNEYTQEIVLSPERAAIHQHRATPYEQWATPYEHNNQLYLSHVLSQSSHSYPCLKQYTCKLFRRN